jgi:AmmeMemoRadiSam system protein B/AmmeMemoRadiSam system protein A
MAWSSLDVTAADAGVRRPAVAGAFYPGNAAELKKAVGEYLENVPDLTIDGTVVAALAPHAGYRYSAQVAAFVHKAIEKTPVDTMVIIGHDAHAEGVVAILADVKAFDTPVGRVEVDREMVHALADAHPGIITHNRVHQRDHTVEVHLPFVKLLKPNCRIVPVLFGDPNPENCRVFADAIQKCAGDRKVFILASTDLSHYPTYTHARELDRETVGFVEKMDLDALFNHLRKAAKEQGDENVQTAMCASGGVGTAMITAQRQGATTVRVLDMASSGDVPASDRTRVVGYAAALFIKPADGEKQAQTETEDKQTAQPGDTDFAVSEQAQKELLTLARNRIEAAAHGEKLKYRPPVDMKELLQHAPVFVTLHKDGELRGCIGMTQAHGELWRAVYDMAYSAAFEDPRFPKVRKNDVDDLHIEISVLSPLTEIDSADNIVPRKHGVVVRQGFHTGLFLPQVWEQLPDKERFMDVLCTQKAHLPADAWKEKGTDLLVFTVFSFEEPK